MAKLNQIIAIEKGIKSRAYGAVTELHKLAQKPELFNGFSKTYQPIDDEGEKLPAESKRVQLRSVEVLRQAEHLMIELMLVAARKDWSNCIAKGNIVVDGKTLIEDVPVSNLLFIEKHLTDLRTFIGTLPVLDEGEEWPAQRDPNDGLFKTPAVKTHRTKKTARAIMLAAATVEHPAQTQLITEDLLAGYWSTVKQSGAMPSTERDRLMERVEAVILAVKQAREAANGIEEWAGVPDVGGALFDYILGT